MNDEAAVLAAEQSFFDALMNADREALMRLLPVDFSIVDVMAGSVVPQAGFVDFVTSGGVKFEKIDRVEAAVRFYGSTSIIVGRTEMAGLFQDQPFSMSSRYTHVFLNTNDGWKLVAAQGTQIAE
jgi:ketosteroid isomerase-like protein